MSKPLSIDIHAHILTERAMERLGQASPRTAPALTERTEDSATLSINGKLMQKPLPREVWDVQWRLRDMDRYDIDMQLLQTTTQTLFYDEDAALAEQCAVIQNEEIAAVVAAYPKRFMGLGTLPMQSGERSEKVLRSAIGELGLKGVMIGSNISSRNLDDPDLEPVWATAAELGALIFIHPLNFASRERLTSYYLSNFVGLPFETTLAATSLVFSGVLERYPSLKICLAHGGGYMPYQRFRFIHGWNVRPEPKVKLDVSPEASLARLYVDTIVHSRRTLEFLAENAGSDHVMLGSDYPFDMGNLDCVQRVKETGLTADDQARILGGNAAALLELHVN